MQSKVVLPDIILELDAGGLPSWVPADGRPASDALGAAASNLSLSLKFSAWVAPLALLQYYNLSWHSHNTISS